MKFYISSYFYGICLALFLIPLFVSANEQGDTDNRTIKKSDKNICESDVDMADDINFADKIVECNNEALIIYDVKLPPPRQAPPKKVFEHSLESSSSKTLSEPAHSPGARFIIRAHYTLDSPESALKVLFQQMSTYCPLGWELDRQWSEGSIKGHYLHYEFTCLAQGG